MTCRFGHWLAILAACFTAVIVSRPEIGAAAPPALQLTLVSQDLAVPTDGSLILTLEASEAIPIDAEVLVTAYRRVVTRGELRKAIDGEFPLPIDSLVIPTTALIVAGTSLTITVPTESTLRTKNAISLQSAGVYPIIVALKSSNDVVASVRSVVQRLPSVTDPVIAPLQVSVVSALSTPPQLPGQASPLPASVTDALTRFAALAPELHTTLSISPNILERLEPAVLDQVRPALQASALLSQTRFPFDPSIAAAAGQQQLFQRLLVDGETALETTAETVPTDRSLWIEPGELSTAGGELLRGLGVRMAVLTPSAFSAAAGALGIFTDTSRKVLATTGSDALPIAVIDIRVAEYLTAVDGSVEQRALYAAADLVVARDEFVENGGTSGQTLFLSTPDAGIPDAALLNRIGAMVAPSGAISFLTLADALQRTDQLTIDGLPQRITLPEAQDNGLGQRIGRIQEVRSSAMATSSMLADDDPQDSQWMGELDVISSTSLGDNVADAALTALQDQLVAIQGSVELPAPFSFTLSGRQTTIPITLKNTSDTIRIVLVKMSSSKMTFPDGPQLVRLPPNSSTDVAVNASALSNGSFVVELNVLTPVRNAEGQDVFIAAPVNLRARVTTLTGLAQVLTGGGLLMVLAWWFKNARGSRRRKSIVSNSEAHPSALR